MNESALPAVQPHPRIVCLGDMAADIFASVMPHLPQPGQLLLCDRIAFLPGGNALNTAIALQKLGERVSFFGSLGDDPFGDLVIEQLRKIGMDTRGVKREPAAATPTTLIYRSEGEDRRFIHALGAADRFTGENVSPELLPEGGVLLAAGYLKLRSWSDHALLDLFREARKQGCTVVLNVCIPGESVDASRCLRALPLVDILVHNEDEARLLTGRVDLEEQARVLREAGAKLVVITRGSKGLFAQDATRTVEMGAYPVPLVDPTGCGDCFSAGLIAALLRGWDLVDILRFACAVGALGATALGCTTGVPEFAEVECFVARNEQNLPSR
jgi:sugar/nucleoside kinase (ribokinase family)